MIDETIESAESALAQNDRMARAFAPGMPLRPQDGVGGQPRQWDYPSGYNITSRPRNGGRVSFQLLKELTDAYDVVRMCIGRRIDNVRSLDWAIKPMDHIEQNIPDLVDAGYRAMRKPDGVHSFESWLAMVLEDVFRYDAGCLYRRRNRAGQVIALDVVDGKTIAPVLDYWGRRPVSPAPAYVQYVQGVPWKWLSADDLIYEPFRPQPDSPYGYAPLEGVLLAANTDIRFQMHFLNWFTDGTVPEGFVSLPEDIKTPEMVHQWQEYWDALLYGDEAAKHQLKFVPHGTEFEWPKEKDFKSEFPFYLMRKVCAAFHVTPNDLGFTDDVNRSSSESQIDVQFRIGTLPVCRYLQGILSRYLQEDLGLPVEFQFNLGQDASDRVELAQADKIYIESGVVSPEEVRAERFGYKTDTENPVPRFIIAGKAVVPLSSITHGDQPADSETYTATPTQKPTRPALPAAKATGPSVAGLAVTANDTGRALLLQRAVEDGDPAAGRWEFPGGHLEDGETAKQAAVREWQEETGLQLPAGKFTGTWNGKGSVYQGFIYLIPSENDLPINLQDGRIANPDDPGGDHVEACAWWEPADLTDMPALRDELRDANPFDQLQDLADGDVAEVRKELAKWKSNSLSRVKRNQRPRMFKTTVIPGQTISDTWSRLKAADTVDKVEKAFNPDDPPEGMVRPKGSTGTSWRDTPPSPVPQHDIDLQLTDHYAPLVVEALQEVWDVSKLRASGVQSMIATGTVPDDVARVVNDLHNTLGEARFQELLSYMHTDAFDAGAMAALKQLGQDVPGWTDWKPGQISAPYATGTTWREAANEAGLALKGISDSTRDRIGEIITKGVARGDTVDDMARQIYDYVASPVRAEMIAHTESNRMVTLSSIDQYRQAGITKWDLVISAGACPICLDVQSRNPHPMSDTKDQSPLHPRCRCSVAPIASSVRR